MVVSAVISVAILFWLSWKYAHRTAAVGEQTEVTADTAASILRALAALVLMGAMFVGLFVFPHAMVHFAILVGLFYLLPSVGVQRWGWFTFAGLLAAVLVYQADVREVWALTRDAARFREQYPLVALAPRLAYEQRPYVKTLDDTPLPLRAPRPDNPRLTVATHSDHDDHYFYWKVGGRRRHSLGVIHQAWKNQFENMMGFGLIRMRWIPSWRNDLVPLPAPPALYLSDEYASAGQLGDDRDAWFDFATDVLGLEPPSTPLETHFVSSLDFVNPVGWGYQPYDSEQTEVAGFQSHHFRHRPVMLDASTQAVDRWRIVKLQLVSLLKHDTPQVYLDDALPNMERLASEAVPTRDLDEFEGRALRELMAGNDLAVEESPERIRMLGSLRANKTCRDCHSATETSLLGAFSYELRLAPEVQATGELP